MMNQKVMDRFRLMGFEPFAKSSLLTQPVKKQDQQEPKKEEKQPCPEADKVAEKPETKEDKLKLDFGTVKFPSLFDEPKKAEIPEPELPVSTSVLPDACK